MNGLKYDGSMFVKTIKKDEKSIVNAVKKASRSTVKSVKNLVHHTSKSSKKNGKEVKGVRTELHKVKTASKAEAHGLGAVLKGALDHKVKIHDEPKNDNALNLKALVADMK